MYDYSYIGRLLQIFWKLFVIFKLSKQFCENYNVGAWFNYVLGKYFDSLNVANLELQIMAKHGQIIKYMYIVLWFMCCTLVPCSVYWCLAVLISLCGVNVVYLWRLLIWDWWFLSFLSTALPEHGGWLWKEGRPIHSTLSQSLGANIVLVAW